MVGRQLRNFLQRCSRKTHFRDHLDKADENSLHIIGTDGNEAWAHGEWSSTLQKKTGDPIPAKGYWSEIYVREGDALKVRMQMWNIKPAPPAPAETK